MTDNQFNIGFNGRTLSVPDPGGPARVGRQLLNGLSQIQDEVIVFGHESLADTIPVQLDSTGFYQNSRLYGMLWEQMYLPKQAKLNDVDVIYSPNSLLPIFWKESKFVITIHDLASFEGYSSKQYRWYEQIKLPIVAKRADRIITVSEFSKQKIVDDLGIPKSKISIVHNGVSEIFRDDTEGKSFDLPEKYILYVGDASKRKNIDGTISAFEEFNKRSSQQYKLVLIGPTDSPTVNNLSIQTKPHIINPGYISDQKLKYAYRNADVFLFPSRYEGFGIPPLEAMSCGTPVIASNTSALPEILGDAALFADPENHTQIADKIMEITTNDLLANDLINQGKKQAHKYSWKKSSQQLQEILYTVCAES